METAASPTLYPFKSASEISLAANVPFGFLNVLPKLGKSNGCFTFLCSLLSSEAALSNPNPNLKRAETTIHLFSFISVVLYLKFKSVVLIFTISPSFLQTSTSSIQSKISVP